MSHKKLFAHPSRQDFSHSFLKNRKFFSACLYFSYYQPSVISEEHPFKRKSKFAYSHHVPSKFLQLFGNLLMLMKAPLYIHLLFLSMSLTELFVWIATEYWSQKPCHDNNSPLNLSRVNFRILRVNHLGWTTQKNLLYCLNGQKNFQHYFLKKCFQLSLCPKFHLKTNMNYQFRLFKFQPHLLVLIQVFHHLSS